MPLPLPKAGVLKPDAEKLLSQWQSALEDLNGILGKYLVGLVAGYARTSFQCKPVGDEVAIRAVEAVFNPQKRGLAHDSHILITVRGLVIFNSFQCLGVWDLKKPPLFYNYAEPCNRPVGPIVLKDGRFVSYSHSAICVWDIDKGVAHRKWITIDEDSKGNYIEAVSTTTAGVMDFVAAQTSALPPHLETYRDVVIHHIAPFDEERIAVYFEGKIGIINIDTVTIEWKYLVPTREEFGDAECGIRIQAIPDEKGKPRLLYVCFEGYEGEWLFDTVQSSCKAAPCMHMMLPLIKPYGLLIIDLSNRLGVWPIDSTEGLQLPATLEFIWLTEREDDIAFWTVNGAITRRSFPPVVVPKPLSKPQGKIDRLLRELVPWERVGEFPLQWHSVTTRVDGAVVSITDKHTLQVWDPELDCVLMDTPLEFGRQYHKITAVGTILVAQLENGQFTLYR